MFAIQFPKYDFQFKTEGGKRYIFDIIRKKYIVLTPEEFVRQHLLHYLIETKGYPKSLLAVEMSLAVNQMQKRCDIAVYDRNGQAVLIVECKAPSVKLDQKVFDQVAIYNLNLQVPYLLISNGSHCYCSKVDLEKKQFSFLEEIPPYESLS